MPSNRALVPLLAGLLLVSPFLAITSGCSSPRARPRDVTPVVRDVPSALRNTVFARSSLQGIDPTLVSGFGLVVGLNGTGGLTIDDRIAVTMTQVMGRNGIGRGTDAIHPALVDRITGLPKTPRQLLRDPNVAVVLVEAAIPPGSPSGYNFDVFVRALNASSLEGGTLWSTDLRVGGAQTFGGMQTRLLGRARGPIYINPFADAGAETAGVTLTSGRILDGGVVTEPFGIQLVLDNPSPVIARSIVDAVNSRFPERPGDDGPAARGRSAADVEIRIPARFRERPGEFIRTLEFLTIDGRFEPEAYARGYVREIRARPGLAEELGWCLVGLGERAIPLCRELYNDPELIPKLAGLRAGALLGDPRAAEPLLELARAGATSVLRAEAIGLVARLDAGPSVDLALRELTEADELAVRVAAYEARADRAKRRTLNRLVERERARPAGSATIPIAELERYARVHLPEGTIQGVSRRPMGGEFLLDRVRGGDPLIYVTQQGEPRVVLFGASPEVRTPTFVSALDGRFLLVADDHGSNLRVRYVSPRSGRETQHEVEPDLASLVTFLARDPSPEDPRPGLGMSYSEVVGTLHAIHAADATPAGFATERDRLLAQLFEASRGVVAEERPETDADDETIVFRPDRVDADDPTISGATAGAAEAPERRRLVVPIERGGSEPN